MTELGQDQPSDFNEAVRRALASEELIEKTIKDARVNGGYLIRGTDGVVREVESLDNYEGES